MSDSRRLVYGCVPKFEPVISDGEFCVKPRIVFLASAWGPRHGGINSFNADLAIATAQSISDRSMECLCVTAEAPSDHELREAGRYAVDVVTAAVCQPEQWTSGDAESIHRALVDRGSGKVDWWIGHDVVTGEAAVALAQRAGGRSAVIHHMSYADYAGYKNTFGRAARAKRERQRRIFTAAHRLLAVGPLLQRRLAEMVGVSAHEVTALIPGLADITVPPERSSAVSAIVFGRLDVANDRIKQARLAISAFASAVKYARRHRAPAALREAPKITMMGVREAEEQGLKQLASCKAGAVVNLIAIPFLEDRDLLLRELREANLALVSSWHEGFGLTAWEAIAAQVPLVVGRNTGVYQLLENELAGAETGFVRAVDVRGALFQRGGGHFRREDEQELKNAILDIARDLARAQERARLLRSLLGRYTWPRTAEQLARALDLQRYTKRLVDFDLVSPACVPLESVVPLRSYRSLGYESAQTASLLLSEARLAYGRGSYEAVYKTSVRAARAFEDSRLHTDAVSALTEAMSALRPGRQGRELREIILKIYRVCAVQNIALAVRWLFLDRLALVLFDYGNFTKAAQVTEASEKLFRRVLPGATNPQQLAFDSANSFRRRAIIKGSAGNLGDGRQLRRVLDELMEHSQQFSKDRHFNSFATNLDVASKLAAEVLRDSELAHKYSLQALERRGDIDHWWVLQEHLWREAEYYRAGGDDTRTLDTVVEVLRIHQRWPVILEPVTRKSNAWRGDLRIMVERLGIDLLDVSERGVRLNQLTATPLGISDQTIDRIVQAVMP